MSQGNKPVVANRISDGVKASIMRMIKKDEAIVEKLAPEVNPERRQYPESEFRRHFLPIVSGEAMKDLPEGYTAERLTNEATDYWSRIAGGLNQEVEVVDATGNIAFIVPALMDTTIVNTAQPPNDAGLRAVNHEYQQRVLSLPEAATARLNASLSEKLIYLFKDQADKRGGEDKMKKIREYYGIEPSKAVAAAKPADGDGKSTPVTGLGEMHFD